MGTTGVNSASVPLFEATRKMRWTRNRHSLRSAFEDINGALTEISTYRREALPQMASTILELDKLTAESEEAIDRMERGQTASEAVGLE